MEEANRNNPSNADIIRQGPAPHALEIQEQDQTRATPEERPAVEEEPRDHTINIDKLISDTEGELAAYCLESGESRKWQKKRLIGRVPNVLHEMDREAYEPYNNSIGPYHYKNQNLECSKTNKHFYLKLFQKISNIPIDKYYRELLSIENEARGYYLQDIAMATDEFLKMLLFDSSLLLIELNALDLASGVDESSALEQNNLVAQVENSEENNNGDHHISPADSSPAENQEPVISMDFNLKLLHDMLLYENQIPFFVLERILGVDKDKATINKELADRAEKYLKDSSREHIPVADNYKRPEEIHHLLHLFHSFYRFKKPSKPVGSCVGNGNQLNTTRSESNTINPTKPIGSRQWRQAIEYHKVGVHFKKIENNSNSMHSLLDIELKHNKLLIPQLVIDDYTNYKFRNLIVFEQQTNGQFGYDVSTYIFFMSHLLSSPEDVRLLVRREVISNHLGSDDNVSQLFINLGKSVTFNPNADYYKHLESVNDGLENHYRIPLNRWFALLRHKYFSNPWLVVGLLVGTITFVCVILQAIFQVLKP